jgi:hypothetical protein
MVSETIILAVSTLGTGFLALVARLIYSSKCAVVKCCCCEVQRNVDQEISAGNINGEMTAGTNHNNLVK